MHKRQICHRDIKLDNLIIDPTNGLVKIIDFGFAQSCKERLKVYCGTPSYMLPELIQKKEYSGADADLWAAGVVLYTMLTGMLPFRGKDEKEAKRRIQRG